MLPSGQVLALLNEARLVGGHYEVGPLLRDEEGRVDVGYIACFAMSLGPVVWVVIAEIFPTKIRGRAMAVATLLLWAANFVVSQTFPIINEDAWLVSTFHHAFPFWMYAAFCAVMLVFVHRVVPETKGKTLEEIERSWHRRDG